MQAVDPSHVSFTLEGCRSNTTIIFPPGGPFICPDAAYTTGNLGKGWNELDLVPHRLTADAGNAAPTTQTYTMAVAVDAEDAGRPGYDFLSAAVLNASLSDASCTAPAVSGELLAVPGLGGTDVTRYRLLTITQAKNTECVYDFYARLALGSHLYPGSSLHANKALPDNGSIKTAGIGASDVSIPVNEILPQELRKDMAASQGSDHVWNITKEPTPATLSFTNTCDTSAGARQAGVTLTVTWQRLAASPSGDVTVITNIYAKNPSHRTITVNVTDTIYSGLVQVVALTGSNPASSGDVAVPANTEALVFTHTITVAAGTADLNDIATATYIDQDTGIPVPGQTEATASAVVQQTGPTSNQTATIADSETISGTDLSFSADSFAPLAAGSFQGGYVAGTVTTGPVDWLSVTQSGDGQVVFSKTVYVDQPAITSGTLSDTASLLGSDGFTASASATVTISASALVELTINKTIPNILSGAETDTFFFEVYDSADNLVASPAISFAAGETAKSTTVSGLAPDTYTVKEVSSASGTWPLPGDQVVSIALPSCSESVLFENSPAPASARAIKVTIPAGFEAGWEFTLTGPGTPIGGETAITDAGGIAAFLTQLEEGLYTITETPQPGWEAVGPTSCTFTVDYPADFDRLFECTFTNQEVPTGRITPTGTTCEEFVAETADDLTQVNYRTRSGFINNVAPGVFFYYSTVIAPSSSFTIDVVQEQNPPPLSPVPFPLFAPQNLENVRLYDENCVVSRLGTASISGGQAQISVSGATVGQVFIVSVKYETGTVVGAQQPNPTTVHYDFETQVNGATVDSDTDGVNLVKVGGD